MPVMLDVGTNNETLLNDPLYIGLERRRVRGEEYDKLVDEFITAANEVFPGVLIQLEDFANANAFRLLARYRNEVCLFDDDIQGTGAVGVAGVIGALRISGGQLAEQKLLFLGAGEAAIGVADVFAAALMEQGVDQDEARRQCWLFDSKGLVVAGRDSIDENKSPYAHEHVHTVDFLEAVEPDLEVRVHGRAGLHLERGARDICERQPIRSGIARERKVRSRPG
jgi:malate dehydrogenase (oxaloacetate-decarboxylating)(NADP+)